MISSVITPLNYKIAFIVISQFLTISTIPPCDCIENENYLYPVTNNRVKSYVFILTEGTVQPDNYKQRGYLINGKFPGPTIFVNQFDLLQVTVINRMSTTTTIHWHGLLQGHSVAADGVPYVTQDPIMPNQTYVYEIQIGTQTGTFVYHGHVDYDIVFIHGALIVRDNPSFWNALGPEYHYDRGLEHTFLLEELYHYSLDQFLIDVTGPWKGKPRLMSLAINGQSYGDWKENNGNALGYEVVKVNPGKIYRFRIINIAAESMLLFKIEGHKFRVIEMDGILTFPTWATHLEINSGQRYSILITMDKPISNYWIHNQLISPFSGGPDNGRAILSYVGAEDPETMRKEVFALPTRKVEASTWILPQLQPNRMLAQTEVYELPRKSNRRIFIDTHMALTKDKAYQFLVNGHHWQRPTATYLTQIRKGIDVSKNDPQVYEIFEGQIVDIVFQNRVMDDGPCLQHPWHLHGHSFYIVAEGPDVCDPSKLDNEIEKNILNGRLQFRDVFTMFPYQKTPNTTSGAGCGWAVIRFIANNPGVWIAHCHITTHMLLGKQFVIYEHRVDNPRLVNE